MTPDYESLQNQKDVPVHIIERIIILYDPVWNHNNVEVRDSILVSE